MADPVLTAAQVKEILKKNGVESLDQLASLIAAQSAANPGAGNLDPLGKSWVIKVWELDRTIDDLPDHLGGDILRKLKAPANAGGVGGPRFGG
jgi:hypothetical protein